MTGFGGRYTFKTSVGYTVSLRHIIVPGNCSFMFVSFLSVNEFVHPTVHSVHVLSLVLLNLGRTTSAREFFIYYRIYECTDRDCVFDYVRLYVTLKDVKNTHKFCRYFL